MPEERLSWEYKTKNELFITENSVWERFPATAKKYVFMGLEKTKIYWCRVGVIGSKGQLIFSDPVSKVVQ